MRNTTLCLISGLLMSFFFIVNTGIKAQNYEIAAIGYYNLENLFDTIDSENVRDSEYLPGSKKGWDSERYYEKLDNMACVLSEIATDKTPDGLVVGVSEIENRMVLEDLVKRDALKERHYEIVHYNSPDRRGIDVALVYNPKFFTLTNSYSAPFIDADTNFKTRDQLLVTNDRSNWSFYKAEIFKKPYMINQNGRYKDYPKRTHAGGRYQGGYSDHFPVYVYLIKETK